MILEDVLNSPPKYIIMLSFVASLFLTNSGGYIEFTPKYIIVGDEEEVLELSSLA